MTELLTAAQMRAIEQAAIASGEVSGLDLMERAGRGVVEAIFVEWPGLRATYHRAVVQCGPGNNGGDGFVVARLLKEWGWEVAVFLYGEAEKLPPDARVNYERWLGMGEVWPIEAIGSWSVFDADLLVDALFGIGINRSLDLNIASLRAAHDFAWDFASEQHAHIVAVDVPSGVCGDSGRTLGASFPAGLKVTFQRAKTGHVLGDRGGPRVDGPVRVVDLGLERFLKQLLFRSVSDLQTGLAASPNKDGGMVRMLGQISGRIVRKTEGHKFTYGHALILGGPSGQGGAARLAARGALRIGAGLVTLACPSAAMAENAARLDAIMLREVAGGVDLARVLSDSRITALCLGPGMGTGQAQVGVLAIALGCPPPPAPPHGGQGRRLVLDADALTILSQRPDLFAAVHERCVLTPHAGEFARLFPDLAAKLAEPDMRGPAYFKVDATREAAARAGCVVLFKGPDTVIAAPDGTCAINAAVYDRAAPWLATAGSGDVLAGFITGLLARGFTPFDAACSAAWLHVECARSFGPGLIAEDLPEELPKVLRALGL